MIPVLEDWRSGIYVIGNRLTGRDYVGSAACLHNRTLQHWYALEAGRHCNLKLQHSWNKHGSEAFAFEILEFVEDKQRLIEREQVWITALDAATLGHCASISAVLTGRKQSPETIAKRKATKALNRLVLAARDEQQYSSYGKTAGEK